MSNMTSVRYEVRAGWLDDSPLIGWLTYPRENVPEDEEKDSSRSNSARLAVRSPSSTLIETPSFEYSLAFRWVRTSPLFQENKIHFLG